MSSYILPNNFNELCMILDEELKFTNILFVHSETTGVFLDKIFLEKNVIRINYTPKTHHTLFETINNINTKFDLICLDSFHEYKESIADLLLLTSVLSENGILICHDCCPPNKKCTTSYYKKGEWCGVTYVAFIELAYNNPNLFYGIINKDYGLGIVSKNEIKFVKKILNNEKQKIFLDIYKNNIDKAYNYFMLNAKELINLL